MKNSLKGFSLISVILAALIAAVGVTVVALMMRSQIAQQQSLTAQAQRATYSTVQSEIAVQGIDPSKIVNPMATIAAPDTGTSTSSGTNQATLGAIAVSSSSTGLAGSAPTTTLAVTNADGTGDRTGGFGLTTDASGGTAANGTSLTLAAPIDNLVGGVLTVSTFPASSWFTLPNNPLGTVYRYTTDGSVPTSSSPVWDSTTANAIDLSNFPASLTLKAFHSNPAYTPSAAATTGTLTFQMPTPVFGRASAPAVGPMVVTYNEQFGATPNGITVTPSSSTGPIAFSIYYTTDGTDPSSSPTRLLYTTSFVIPLVGWNWDGTDGDPSTANVSAVVVGPSARYTNSTTAAVVYQNQPVTLAPPGFSFTSAGGPVAKGTTITFSPPSGSVYVRYADWTDPSTSSTTALFTVF